MSQIVDYVRDSVRAYLADEIDTDAFRVSFAGAYHYIRSRSPNDGEANRLASALMSPFAEFSCGHRSEESLRLELAAAIRPVAPAQGYAVLARWVDAIRIGPQWATSGSSFIVQSFQLKKA
ncbi:MAG: hypothetical protein SGI92_29820 [Bryobacteraceae bacterium]|nr:hypothetical protein [Bryobacteraceae bacterium]